MTTIESHGVKLLKRDNKGHHYDGKVYIYPPSRSLGNRVEETMSFASGSIPVGNNFNLENKSVVEKSNQLSSKGDLGVVRSEVATCSTVSSEPILKKEKDPFPPPKMVRLLTLACEKEYLLPDMVEILKVPFEMVKETSRFYTIFWECVYGII